MPAVESSCLSNIAYDKDTMTLRVKFRESGKVYAYYNVRRHIYDELKEADSIGKYYNYCIKGQFASQREE